jgi:hypothetical protein
MDQASSKRCKIESKSLVTETCTIRNAAWLHPNLQDSKIGYPSQGFSKTHFDRLEQQFMTLGATYQRIDLRLLLPEQERDKAEFAEILIVEDGIDLVAQSKDASHVIFQHLISLEHDTKVLNYKKICNRLAQQTTLLVDGVGHASENGMGNVHDFCLVPFMATIKDNLAKWTGISNIAEYPAECNMYNNTSEKPHQCGVGFHGHSFDFLFFFDVVL